MRRTKRGGWPYSQPPNVQFELNKDSPQAKGLVAWWPTLVSQGLSKLYTFPPCVALEGTFDADAHMAISPQKGAVIDTDGNDGVTIADHSLLDFGAKDFTVSIWVYKRSASVAWTNTWGFNKWNTGGDNTNEWAISLTSSGDDDQPTFYIRDAASAKVVTSPDEIALNEWHLITGTKRGANSSIYVDGILKATRADVGNVNDAGRDLYIARSNIALGNTATDGQWSDVRIYHRAFNSAGCRQLYTEPWELHKPLIRRWLGWESPITVRIPRYGFTNFQVPGVV